MQSTITQIISGEFSTLFSCVDFPLSLLPNIYIVYRVVEELEKIERGKSKIWKTERTRTIFQEFLFIR